MQGEQLCKPESIYQAQRLLKLCLPGCIATLAACFHQQSTE